MKHSLFYQNQTVEIHADKQGSKLFLSREGSEEITTECEVEEWTPPTFKIRLEGKLTRGYAYRNQNQLFVHLPEGTFEVEIIPRGKKHKETGSEGGDLSAPMPGKVIKVFVKEGDTVQKGDLLMVLEAMKMEHKITSGKEGLVKKINFQELDRVSQGDELLIIE